MISGCNTHKNSPDSKVHVANMGPIWDRQDPGWPHVGPTNLAIWVCIATDISSIALRKWYMQQNLRTVSITKAAYAVIL